MFERERLYKDIFGTISSYSVEGNIANLVLIEDAIEVYKNKSAVAVLKQLFDSDGVEDGDIISPAGRDVLLKHQFCVKTIKNKQWGYQTCTYHGAWAIKVIEWLEANDK